MTPNEWDQLTAKSQIDEKDPNGKPEDRTTYYGQYGKNVTWRSDRIHGTGT